MKVQDLIGEVAKRHNLLVDAQDPILVAVTVNELLLAEHLQRVEASLERAEKAATLAATRHLEGATRSGADLLAEISRHLMVQIRASGSALRTNLQQAVHELVLAAQAASAEAVRQRRASQRAAAVAIGAACLLVGMLIASGFRAP